MSAHRPVAGADQPPQRTARPRPPYPLKLQLEQLEPRLLLSADGLGLAPELVMPGEQPVYAAVSAPSQSAEPASAAIVSSRELVFIDPRVPDAKALLADLIGDADPGRKFEVIILDTERDGIVQVTAALKSRMQLDAVHFITHGSDGAIQLGGTLLDAKTLAENTALVGAWGDSLKEDADLLFYGCDLAASARGRALVDWIADLTGADVAASTDATGSALQGGDWELEYKAGAIETPVAASAAVQSQWSGLLATTAATEFRVNTVTGNTQAEATVARDAVGNFVVAWTGRDANGNGVFAQRFDANGVPVGGEFQVNSTTADDQQAPAIAMDDLGNFVIVWQSHNQDGDNWGVYARRYNASGVAQGSEFRVNTFTAKEQQAPVIAMDATGNFVVAWESHDQDGDNYGVYAQRYNASGVAQGSEFRVNTYTTKEQQAPAIAMNAAGNFVIVWESHDQDGDNYGIYGRQYDAAGFPLGLEFRVNSTTAKAQQNAAVAMDAAGNFVVAWQSDSQDGDKNGIYAQRYNASGVKQGGEFRVNTYTTKDQQAPAVAMAADGRFTIVWQSDDQDGDQFGVYAKDYSAAGVAGSEFRINTYTTHNQQAPAIAMNRAGLGHYVVAWDGEGSGDTAGIFAQRYTVLQNGTILDLFSSTSFSGNDGTQNWKNDWQELGETGGPGSGTVQVTGGALQIGGTLTNISGRGAARAADLSGATSATLTFSYRKQGLIGGGSVSVQVSPDGVSWTTLASYDLSTAPSTFTTSPSFDISPYISANTQVRFIGSGTTSSYFQVDYVQIEHNGAAVNQAPVLNSAKSPVLGAVDEDAGAPVGPVGTLVSQLVDFAVPAGQVDNVTDADSGAALGLAITGVDTANGTWWYSLDDGASWNMLGAVSDASALLLAADGTTRVYFQGNPDYNGAIANALTFRAWDQTAGTNGALGDTTLNGGATAFSTATDTASIVVNPVNDAPMATNLSAPETYTEDTALDLTDIVVSDIDSASVTVTLTLSDLAAGSLNTGTAGAVTSTFVAGVWSASGAIANVNTLLAGLTFTPALNYNGNFSIATSVSDGVAPALTGTKAMTGIPVDDAPTSTNDSFGTAEDTPYVLSLSDFGSYFDVEGTPIAAVRISALATKGTLEYDTTGGGAWAAVTLNQVISAPDIAANRLRFVPGADEFGSPYATIGFQVSDGAAFSTATYTLTASVTAVNDAPSVTTSGGAVAYTENDPATPVDPAVTVNDVDNASLASATARITGGYANGQDVLTFTGVGGITGFWTAATGTLTLNGPGTLAEWQSVLQSVAFQNTSEAPTAGPRTIELVVNDGALDSVVATRTVNVTAVNDAPVAVNASASGLEDDPSIAITLTGTDVDDSITSFRLLALPANGLLYTDAALTVLATAATDYPATGNALTLYFVPAADWNGATGFQFTAKDAGGLVSAAPATAVINVAAVNDAPVAGNDPAYTMNEDTSLSVAAAGGVLANDFDIDSSPITAVLVTGPSNAAAFSLNPDGSFTYTPRADYYGTDTFTYQAFDGSASSNVATVTITVNNVADHTVIVDTAADYTSISPNWGDTSSIDALLKSKGADGLISLREAIVAANNTVNAGGPDRIYFQIAGSQTINVGSALPTIADAVIIDGTTDSDFAGTPVIVLDGSGAGAGAHGLRLDSTGSTIRGLVIDNFRGSGLFVGGGGGNVIQGNYIGIDATGNGAAGNNGYGVWLASGNNIVGGTSSADRNVISGSGIDGVYLAGSGGNVIQGNYIGTNAAGTAAIANAEDGIWLNNASSNIIGGTGLGAGNVISGNGWSGVALTGGGSDNAIRGNLIGVDAGGTAALGNLRHGVQLLGSNGTTIGGAAAGSANVIANNGQNGVSIEAGTGHSVLGNSIYANGQLGIDIGNDGVTANDAGDADLGTNLGMNAPVIYSILLSGGNITVTGEARSGARVELYKAAADPTGHGEGQTFLYAGVVSGATPGVVDPSAVRFSFTFLAGPVATGDQLTATATDPGGNTSEFSANAFVSTALPGITVTPVSGLITTEDGGTATFSVVLDSQPNATVTIALASDNPAEGTIPVGSLVFDSANWNVAQFVTVTGVEDFVLDGDIAYNIVLSAAASADAGYNGLDPADVALTNLQGVNDAPVNNVPSAQIGAEDTPLVFSTGTGNAISISDVDAGPNPLEVTLTAVQGTLTLAGVAGLTFTTGTGTGETTMTFTGTLADINAALDGLTFDPTPGYGGPASVSITTNDQGASGSGGPQSDSDTVDITVNAVNDAPTIDLDADDSSGATGTDYQQTYTEQSGPVLIVDSTDAVLGDVDSLDLAWLTVSITNADFDGAVEFLSADTTATPLITAIYNTGTGVLTLNGAAPIADYQQVLRTVRYENTSDAPSANPRSIAFVASDGGAASTPAISTITINAVNDAPTAVIAAPSYAAIENAAPLVLHGTGMSVADIDARPTSIVTVYLGSISGILSASAGSTGVIVAGSGSPNLTFTGTLSQVNALLAGGGGATITYVVGSDSPAPTDTLSLAINDNGATGTGGALWGWDSVTVNLTAVNDAPLITIPGAASTPEDSSLVFLAGSPNEISITDVDAGASPVVVTLNVSTGTLTLNAAATAGLATLVGDATGSITMTGTVANINLALDGLTFTPPADYNGPAYLTLSVDDQGNSGTGGALTDADSMTISVTPTNDAPAGADNSVSTPENTAYAFVVADFGFSDGDAGDSLSGVRIDSLTLPAGATLQLLGVDVLPGDVIATADITAGNLVFTPAPGPGGTGYATFTFSVRDSGGAFDPTPNTMTIDVTNAPVNTIPGAQTVDVDTDLSITGLSVADPDFDLDTVALSVNNGTVTVTLAGGATITGGANGSTTLTLSGTEADINATLATLVYRGGLGYAGPDTLTITSTDLLAQKDTDSIAITVSQLNNPPTAMIAAAGYAATEQVPLVLTGDLWVDDTDAGAAIVTVRISAVTGTLMVNAGGTGTVVTGSGSPVATLTGTLLQVQGVLLGNAGASVQYLMTSDAPPATDTLTLWINDNHATDPRTASATTTITITAVNDAPVNTLPGGATTLEDTPLVYSGASQISVTDVDAGGAPLQVTLNASNGVITLGSTGGITFISGDGVSDSYMQFTGTVASINTALNGLVFVPNLNYNGLAFITMTSSDGAATDTDLATINVLPVNDAPDGTDTTVTATEDTPYTFTLGTFGFNDVDSGEGDYMTAVRIDTLTLPAGATLKLNGIDVTPGQVITSTQINSGWLVFTPVADANGTNYASFTFSVADFGVPPGTLFDPVPNRMTIDVAPVNDPPIITSDGGGATAAFVIAENTTAVTTVTATDVDLQPLTYSLSGPDAGRFTINATTGVLTFASAPNFEAPADSGADNVYNVNVIVSDGFGGSDTQALTITVTDADDAPFALADSYTTNEDTVLTVAAPGALANDYDEDGSPISATLVSGATYGSLTFNADGSFVYTPNANFFGTDSFVYRVSDGALQSGNATVTLTVSGIPDAPTSANGNVSTDEGVTYAFTLADFNYSDADGDPLDHIQITSLPTVGTLLLGATPVAVNDLVTAADIAAGKLRYAPPASVAGPLAETFGFRVHDGTQYQTGGQIMTVGVAPLPITPPPPPTGGGGGAPPPSTGGGSGGSGSGSGGGSGSTGTDAGEAPPAGGGRSGSGGGESAAAPPPEAPVEDAKVQAPDGAATNTPPSVADSSMTVRAGGITAASEGGGLGTPAVSEATKHEQEASAAAVAALSAPEFQDDLNKLREQNAEEATGETRVAGTVFAASTSLSVGYVIWLLRGGVLLSSLLSSLPAWRLVDPLPVLSRLSDESDDEDDASLEELVTQEGNDEYAEDGADDVDADEPDALATARAR